MIANEPPSEREGDHGVVEGACENEKIALFNAKRVFYHTAFSRELFHQDNSSPSGFPHRREPCVCAISNLGFTNKVCQ